MPVNKISTEIEVIGDKEYREAITGASRQLKLLRSELNRDVSEMGKDADAKKKNAVQTENLKKKIAEQEKIVEANRRRLATLKQQYGENSAEAVNFASKLADSETALNRSRNYMQELERQMASFGNQSEEAGKQLSEGLIKNLEFNQAIEKFRNLGSIVSGVLSGIANTAKTVVGSIISITEEVSNAADAVVTHSQTTRIDLDTLLQIRAAEAMGYDITSATFASAAAKLGTSRTGSAFAGATKNKEAGYFADILAANPGATNEELMWSILNYASTKYNPKGDNSELDAALQAALGKSYTDFRPYLLDGGASYRAYVEKAQGLGTVRTSEQANELASIDDYIRETEALKDSIDELVVFLSAPDIKRIISDFNNVLTAINSYLNPEDDNEKSPAESLADLQKSVSTLATDIAEAVKTAFQALWDFIKAMSETTDDNGNPTVLAQVATRLLELKNWFDTEWPSVWADIKATFETLGYIVEKVGEVLGFGKDETKITGSASYWASSPVEGVNSMDYIPPEMSMGIWGQTAKNPVAGGSFSPEHIAQLAGRAAANSTAAMLNKTTVQIDGQDAVRVIAPYVNSYLYEALPEGQVWE